MPSLADVLDTCADDTLLAIAAALDSPVDILRLAATCRAAAQRLCFATTGYSVATTATDGAAAVAVATQPVETWSIADEAARQWLLRCSDQERGWVPRRGRESWLGLMWEVQVLRRAARFGCANQFVALSEDGRQATRRNDIERGYYLAAMSTAVMRAGCHYVQFAVKFTGDGDPRHKRKIYFGVVRPTLHNHVKLLINPHVGSEHCFVRGMGEEDGDVIGLLLDLGEGRMTVYKNGEKLYTKTRHGLSGEYCWAVSMVSQRTGGQAVRIEQGVVPDT
jgi:hypothetical protein